MPESVILPLRDGWECTKHVGILLSTTGNRMYGCSHCPYINNRLYHTKMHHQRIHIQHGRALARRRKFEGRDGPSVPDPPPLAKKIDVNIYSEGQKKLKLLCRHKISTASHNALHTMRRTVRTEVPVHEKPDACRFFQQVMTFGEFSITPELDKVAPCVKGDSKIDASARRKALHEIARGFALQPAKKSCKCADSDGSLILGGPTLRLSFELDIPMCQQEDDEPDTEQGWQLSVGGAQLGGAEIEADADAFLAK